MAAVRFVKASIAWLMWRRVKAWCQVFLFGQVLPQPRIATVWRLERWHDGRCWVVYACRGEMVLGAGYAPELSDACAMARLEVRRTVRRRTCDTTSPGRKNVEQKQKDA